MNIKVDDYEILLEENLLGKLNELVARVYSHQKVFIMTDENLFALYKESLTDYLSNYEVSFVVIPSGETSKSLTMYEKVVKELIRQGIRRNHLLIAFGGGVVGDLAGFIAGTLYRGIPFIQIPTSLLAMVDSSIGSKTGIDLKEGKNLLGVFKNPLLVIIDPIVLDTLPLIEYKNGLAEVLKAGIIKDVRLYDYLKTHDVLTINEITMAIHVKRDIVLKDPFEQNERMLLNFGHTFGHAIERHYDYAIKHGVAISYGMLMSLKEGIQRGITNPKLFEEVKSILLRLDLVKEPLLKKEQFTHLIDSDKKQLADGLRFIFIKELGQPEIVKGVRFK